jgi:hypothetical protein
MLDHNHIVTLRLEQQIYIGTFLIKHRKYKLIEHYITLLGHLNLETIVMTGISYQRHKKQSATPEAAEEASSR